MLSSSTIHLDLAESNSTQLTTADDITQSKNTTDKVPAQSSQLRNSYENTVTASTFRDELISHFERRLSDLGPRSKYPYLQSIDQKRSGSGTVSPESTSQSEETLSQEKRRHTWWKPYTNPRGRHLSDGASTDEKTSKPTAAIS
jgi:hypothetical protein